MSTAKPKLFVSVSGGKTSGYMAKRLKDEYADRYEMSFGFANTGKEREETLVFADQCDREWDLGLVWLEALVNPENGVGTTHRVVNYYTASRYGAPFEDVIRKYGIANKNFPHCTRELKERPIRSYLTSIGWDDCVSAIGIRADEPSRIKDRPDVVYPLAHWFPVDKKEINDWWEEQPFNLRLQPHQGNCDCCWKKSTRKLVRIAQESPERYDWWNKMEQVHAYAGPNPSAGPFTFFRMGASAKTILTLAELASKQPMLWDEDDIGGCSESCEVFTT